MRIKKKKNKGENPETFFFFFFFEPNRLVIESKNCKEHCQDLSFKNTKNETVTIVIPELKLLAHTTVPGKIKK